MDIEQCSSCFAGLEPAQIGICDECQPTVTERFLSVISTQARASILDAVAAHYGITSDAALAEVTAKNAEHLLDYLVEPVRSDALALMQRYGMQ